MESLSVVEERVIIARLTVLCQELGYKIVERIERDRYNESTSYHAVSQFPVQYITCSDGKTIAKNVYSV